MTPANCNAQILTPALALLPVAMDSPDARRMLLAIGLQESRLQYRAQIGGPAKGYWQFEQGGGVAGVLRHPASSLLAVRCCQKRNVTPAPRNAYLALETDDVLAACFARLLLWTDPHPLPKSSADGWAYYLRNWRPGKPHEHTWAAFWDEATKVTHA